MKAITRATLFHALLPAALLKLGYLALGLLGLPFLLITALWNPLVLLLLLTLVPATLAAAAGYISLWTGLLEPRRGSGWRGAAQLAVTIGAAIAALVFFKVHSSAARPGTTFNTEYWTAWALLALAWFAVIGPLLALAWSRPWLRDQPPGLPASKLIVLACWFATAAIAWFGHMALAASIAQRSGRAPTLQERLAVAVEADPIAAALCAGNLEAAARALEASEWPEAIDAHKILDRCIAHDRWYERLIGRQRQYPERLPLAIKAVARTQHSRSCSPLHVELLRRVVQIDPLALPLVSRSGVYILCWAREGAQQPLWWTALQTTADPAILRERIRALESAGVQWDGADGRGKTVLDYDVLERLPDDALLQVLKGGFGAGPDLRARLAIEIAARAHRLPRAGTDVDVHLQAITALRDAVPKVGAVDIVRMHRQSDIVRRVLSDRTVDRDALARELAGTLVQHDWDVPASAAGLLRALDEREEAARLERQGGRPCKLPTPRNGWLPCSRFDPGPPNRR